MEDENIQQCPFPYDIPYPRQTIIESLQERITSQSKASSHLALDDLQSTDRVSYTDLLPTVEVLARGLYSQCRVIQGSKVAIYSENSVPYALLVLATWQCGGVVVAINSMLTADEITRQLTVTESHVLFSSTHGLDTAIKAIKGTSVKHLISIEPQYGVLGFNDLQSTSSGVSIPSTAGLRIEEPAVVLFSSGTTGPSKAVQLSHRSVLLRKAIFEHPAFSSPENGSDIVVYSPIAHHMGLLQLITGLSQGATIHIMPKFNLNSYVEMVEKYKVRQLTLVPTLAVMLIKSGLCERYDLRCVEEAICGSAPMSAGVEQQLKQCIGQQLHIRQGYGLTESGGACTLSPVKQYSLSIPRGTIGLVLPLCQIKVIDIATGRSLGSGREGEIWIRSDKNMIGYMGNKLATSATIDADGWLHTGDIGYYDDKGWFFIVDRLKELIKYKGYQVAPSELEALLLKHEAVADVAVVGLPEDTAGEVPAALVVPKHSIQARVLIDYVKANCAPYKQLRGGLQFTDSIPKTASGKVLRRIVRQQIMDKRSKL